MSKPEAIQPTSAVVVSFFDGTHKVHTSFAHVLAVGAPDENGNPALSVAFPDPNASPAVFASPTWHKGYKRMTDVKHVDHPDVVAGKASVAWGGMVLTPAMVAEEAPEIPQPAGDGTRPYLKREVPREVTKPSVQQNFAVQTGKAPQPTTQTPLVNEPATDSASAADPGPADTAGAPQADAGAEAPQSEAAS